MPSTDSATLRTLQKESDATEIRAALVTTAAYVQATVHNVRRAGSCAILYDILKGNVTTFTFLIEFGIYVDGAISYFQDATVAAPSSGVSDNRPHEITVTAANLGAGQEKALLGVFDCGWAQTIRVSVKSDNAPTASTVALYAVNGAL